MFIELLQSNFNISHTVVENESVVYDPVGCHWHCDGQTTHFVGVPFRKLTRKGEVHLPLIWVPYRHIGLANQVSYNAKLV